MKAEFRGLESLKKALESLPKKVQNKLLSKGLREGAKVIAAEERARAPIASGLTKKNIKVRSGKRKKGRVSIRVAATGGHEDNIIGFVVLGRKGQAPNPFPQEAFAAKKGEAQGLIEASIREALADH